jgi:molybdopterin synthase sulfur carrier subunit
MRINVKLYAFLAKFLPPGAVENVAEIEVPATATVGGVLESLALPPQQCHLVLVNGVYVAPSERLAHPLKEGDALAVWPQVAGG